MDAFLSPLIMIKHNAHVSSLPDLPFLTGPIQALALDFPELIYRGISSAQGPILDEGHEATNFAGHATCWCISLGSKIQ
jgi:hypothetical protein